MIADINAVASEILCLIADTAGKWAPETKGQSSVPPDWPWQQWGRTEGLCQTFSVTTGNSPV